MLAKASLKVPGRAALVLDMPTERLLEHDMLLADSTGNTCIVDHLIAPKHHHPVCNLIRSLLPRAVDRPHTKRHFHRLR